MSRIAPLQAFSFDTHPVRVMMRGDEPWFVGKDVCAALEIKNHADALSRLDSDERGVANTDPPRSGSLGGGVQEVVIISEAGVYRLVFTSRTAKAEAFKRWIAHDLLPALRKHGFYAVPSADDDAYPGLADQKVFGIAIPKLNAAARAVSLINRIYGPAAARELWESEPGLPSFRDLITQAGDIDDDPTGCLMHLLHFVAEKARTIGDLLAEGIADSNVGKSLLPFGILVKPACHPDKIFIATDHPFIQRVYEHTQWAEDCRPALLGLKTCFRDPVERRLGSGRHRGVLLSRKTVTEALAGRRINKAAPS